MLLQNEIDNLGYVVMLAPPNTGSEIVDTFKEYEWFEWINGPVGTELGTSEDDIPNQLPPVDFPLGIIAGSVTFNPLYSYVITGIDDGKVSIEKTKVS